jgi:hypothetical protein
MRQKEVLYAKPDFSHDDGVLVSELEVKFLGNSRCFSLTHALNCDIICIKQLTCLRRRGGPGIRTFVRTEIPLSPDYEDEEIRLHATDTAITLRLMGGFDTVVAEAAVGVHKTTGDIITARQEFSYHTDILKQQIEVCSREFVRNLSSETILLRGNQEINRIGLCAAGAAVQLKHTALLAAMQDCLSGAPRKISDAALAHGISVAEKVAMGPYQDKLLVFRNGRISHIFDPEYDDYDTCDTAPLTSHYLQVLAIPVGREYINVIGSSGDEFPGDTLPNPTPGDLPYVLNAGRVWMNFWSFYTSNGITTANRPVCCYYDAATWTNTGLSNGHICNATPTHLYGRSGNHSLQIAPGTARAGWPDQSVPYNTPIPSMYIVAACGSSNHRDNSFVVQTQTSVVELMNYYQW